MKQENLLEALKILNKYIEDDETFSYCDHDQMCFGPNKEDLSKKDLEKLRKLGFWWSVNYDCWSCFI